MHVYVQLLSWKVGLVAAVFCTVLIIGLLFRLQSPETQSDAYYYKTNALLNRLPLIASRIKMHRKENH